MNKLILITILMMSLAIKAQDTVTQSAITTTVAYAVTSTSATLNSKITLNSGEIITEKGFVYSLSAKGLMIGGANIDKAISDREIIHRGTDFSSKNVEGLIANKQYFYKAYVTNNKGTNYGDTQSFTTKPMVACEQPWGERSREYTNSTTFYGIVTIDGIPASEGDEVGAFVGTELRAVQPVNTTTAISIITLVVVGDDSGETITFKVWDKSECKEVPVAFTTISDIGEEIGLPPNTPSIAAVNPTTVTAPTVSTTSESNLTSTTATLNGNMTSNGGETIMERGFVYSLSNTNLEIGGTNVNKEIVSGTGIGDFSVGITDLTPNTTYYYKAYATNSVETSYGVVMNFTTPAMVIAPTVSTTQSVSDLTSTSVTLYGNMTSNGGETIMERGFVYSLSNTNLEIGGTNVNKEIVSGTGIGVFSVGITGLAPNTTYYYKAYATNTSGTTYGAVVSFTTPAMVIAPTVSTTQSVSDLTSTSVTLYGNMTSNGGETIRERGFVYSSSSEDPEIGGANVGKKIISGTGTGDFSGGITGLTPSRGYYYKAYAINNAGTSYGYNYEFSTPATVTAPTIIDITVSSTGDTVTMQTSEPVTLNNVDNEDFTVTSTLNGVITTHQVTNIGTGSIVLTVTPAIPTGATVSISYDPTQGSSTDAIINNAGNPMSSGDITLSNDDFEITPFSVFPNPTGGILNIIVVEKTEYKLLNIRGQILETGVLDIGDSEINLSSFAKGIYLLNIKTSRRSFTEKVVRN